MPISDLVDQNRRELVHTCLELAAQSEHVFTRIYRDEALAAAAHADVLRLAGQAVSPLAGMPVSIKDLLDVAGETTLAGSLVLAGRPVARRTRPSLRVCAAPGRRSSARPT